MPPAMGTYAYAEHIRRPRTYSGIGGPGTFVVTAWHHT